MNRSDIQPWRQRLLDEEQELSERITKLECFVDSSCACPPHITTHSRRLLLYQLQVMQLLRSILRDRLNDTGLVQFGGELKEPPI